MSRPATAFDSPQFTLIPDTESRMFANVSNDLTIEGGKSPEKLYPVVVPTSLFTMMRDIMHVEPDDTAFMYLVKDDDKYVFGLAWGAEDFTDLWTYSKSALPEFLQAEVA